MCCSSDQNELAAGVWLKSLLFLWLLATACRQAFDLIGRLWIPVIVNLIQILTCIAGIFAAYQRRGILLIILSIACLFSMLYNIAIILWYNNVFGDPNRPLLTMGLPHGYSFFVQHTPLCDSFFNVTTARWTQKSNCLLNYTVAESIQASFHFILAFSTAIFSILMAKQRRAQLLKRTKDYASRTQLNKMHIIGTSMAPKPNNCRAPNSTSSTSYLNSSYENPEALVEPPQVLRKTPTNMVAKLPKQKVIEQNDNFSTAATVELNSEKSSKSSNNNNESSPPEEPKTKHLMRRALPERRSCGAQLAKILDQSMDSTCRYSKIGNSRRRSEHLRSTVSANNAVVLDEEVEKDDIPDYLEARSRVAARLANLNGEPIASPKQSTSPYHKRQGSAGNLTSLISFDPKSSTLIRVHEHQNDSEDESVTLDERSPRIYRTNSQEMPPTFPAPTPPRIYPNEQASDSGHHSTNSNNSPNWSQGGISFPQQFNSAYTSQPREISQRQNVKSPESNYEPIGGRLVSTAFPVTHTRQRSYCGVSLSTAMPLAKQQESDSNQRKNEDFYYKDYPRQVQNDNYQPKEYHLRTSPPTNRSQFEEYSKEFGRPLKNGNLYNDDPNYPYYQIQQPIVPINFSRAFHDRWLSGDQSNDDLPPPPPQISLAPNSQLINKRPKGNIDHIEGLLV